MQQIRLTSKTKALIVPTIAITAPDTFIFPAKSNSVDLINVYF